MLDEEKFNQTYKKIVDEYNSAMEALREDAKGENRTNILIIVIIAIINILLNIIIYKLTDNFSFEIAGAFITISTAIFAVIKHRNGKSKIEKYAREFKEKVILMLVKSFNKDFEFAPSKRNG